MTRPTSAQTYRDIIKSGLVGKQQLQILQDLRLSEYPKTNREIAQATGIEPSTVSARRNELMKMGLVKAVDKRHCTISHRIAYTWRLIL